MNHTLFISDLHLEPERPEITYCFLNFLKNQALKAESLYILGDLFEVWVGDDNPSSFNRTIIKAIREVAEHNVSVYFMPGNRDFLIGNQFAKETGCQLLKDPTLINLYGTPTLLTHGDQLCTKDRKHQVFRKYTQHPFCRYVFLKLPLGLRKKIAQVIRQKSKKHTAYIPDDRMDATPKAVLSELKKYGAIQLIHGHTHKPAIHEIGLQKRYVLGDWNNNGSALQCNEKCCKLISV